MGTLTRLWAKFAFSLVWLAVAAVPLAIAAIVFLASFGSSLGGDGNPRIEFLLDALLALSCDLVLALVVFHVVDLLPMQKTRKWIALAVAFFVLALPPLIELDRYRSSAAPELSPDELAAKARADEAAALAESGAERLPVSPFDTAAVGDWCALADARDEDALGVVFVVTNVEPDLVTVLVRASDHFALTERTVTFARREAPPWASLLDLEAVRGGVGLVAVSSVRTEDAELDAASGKATGKTLSISGTAAGGVEVDLVISAARVVQGVGLVSFVQTTKGETRRLELLGHGTKRGAIWGRRPRALSLGPAALNPLETAAPGDWSAVGYALGDERWVTTYEVESVERGRTTVRLRSEDASGRAIRDERLVFPASAPAPWSFAQDHVRALGFDRASCRVVRENGPFSLGGRDFACQKLSAFLAPDAKLEVWLSKDVKGAGIVCDTLTRVPGDRGRDRPARGELVGFGTRDEVLWGTRPSR